MIRPITLGDTRFVVPGLLRTTGDVVLGPETVALLPTPAHLVAVLTGLARQAPLTTVLGVPKAFTAQLRAGGARVALHFGGRGVRALDRVAALCRLQGGQLYTGEGAVFVRMRDAAASLGYDATGAVDPPDGGCVLHDQPLTRTITRLVPMDLARLIERLALIPAPEAGARRALYLTTHPSLARRVARWLRSRGADVSAAFIERDDGPRILFEARHVAPGALPLLFNLPGVEPWRRLHPRIFVQAGHRHPLTLSNVAGLLPGKALRFFGVDGHHTCGESLAFTDAAELGLPPAPPTLDQPVADAGAAPDWQVAQARFDQFEPVPIHLSQGRSAQGEIAARLLRGPRGRRALTALMYRVPPGALAEWQLVAWPDHLLLLGRRLPPIGEPLRRLGKRVFVGLNTLLHPAPDPEHVADLFLRPNEEGVLTPHGAWRWARSAAAPLSRRLCLDLQVTAVEPLRPDRAADAEVQPVDASIFRLFWRELRPEGDA